jgi:hypothetical protein
MIELGSNKKYPSRRAKSLTPFYTVIGHFFIFDASVFSVASVRSNE